MKNDVYSKARQQAETAFGNVQTQFFAKDKAVEELASIVRFRDDKTIRLREARLAKEREGQAASAAVTVVARRRKSG